MSPVKTLHGRVLPQCQRPGCGSSVRTEGMPACSSDTEWYFGVTYQVLNGWVAAGHLHPTQERRLPGIPRSWPGFEIEVARLMGRLTSAGLPVEFAARFARSGERRYELAPGIYVERDW